jgi:hypothetical protein
MGMPPGKIGQKIGEEAVAEPASDRGAMCRLQRERGPRTRVNSRLLHRPGGREPYLDQRQLMQTARLSAGTPVFLLM